MSSLTDYSEKLVLDWLMTSGAATRPTGWYIALFTAAPSDAGGGTEVSGNGYARQAVTFAAASSPGGTTSNTGALSFTAAGGNWGAITHGAVFNASTAGNMLWWGPLGASRTINDGDTITFNIGAAGITLG
jgi:hypothetical protein